MFDEMLSDFRSCLASIHDGTITVLMVKLKTNFLPRYNNFMSTSFLQWTGCMDVNMPCDTGNSPLHVAVNLGNYNLVRVLLNMPDIEVNTENSQCDGATPLHLSVLHGKN